MTVKNVPRLSYQFPPLRPIIPEHYNLAALNSFAASHTRPPFPVKISPRKLSLNQVNVDWKETKKAHLFIVEVPGLKKDQVNGKRKLDKVMLEDDKYPDKWHRMERSRGNFYRKFKLPENAEVERVSAAMEDGVLTVTVPKTNVTVNKAHIMSIPIAG